MILSNISQHSASILSNKIISIIIVIIVTAIVTDISLIKTYDLISKKESFGWRTIVFACLITISIVGQFFLLQFVKQKITNNIIIPKEIRLNTIHYFVGSICSPSSSSIRTTSDCCDVILQYYHANSDYLH
jgi:hypothetical protein